MAGYTRQSAADITPGATVRAAPLNNELNQVRDAFNNTTGHAQMALQQKAQSLVLLAMLVLPHQRTK